MSRLAAAELLENGGGEGAGLAGAGLGAAQHVPAGQRGGNGFCLDGRGPVSYTHLDVYKRQGSRDPAGYYGALCGGGSHGSCGQLPGRTAGDPGGCVVPFIINFIIRNGKDRFHTSGVFCFEDICVVCF